MLYNSMYEFDTLRKVANEIFDNFSAERNDGRFYGSNTYENEGGFLIQLKAPGIKQEDVSVDYQKGYLTVSAKRSEQSDAKKEWKTIRREIGDYSIEKKYVIPDQADIENIEAKIENGLLMIHIPKKEEVKPKKISVEVK